MSNANGARIPSSTKKAPFVVNKTKNEDALAFQIEQFEANMKANEAAMKASLAEIERLKAEQKAYEATQKEEKRRQKAKFLKDAEELDKKAAMYKKREDIDEALSEAAYFRQLASELIVDDEIQLDTGVEAVEPRKESENGVLFTTLKIVGLIGACCWAVLNSGDWILNKYPGAGIYNEVSFQKIIFGFAVYIGGVVASIVALSVFFPGFGKYFNPFNSNSLDFFDDFKNLEPWRRNIIGFGLWAALFLGFLLIATGKLD